MELERSHSLLNRSGAGAGALKNSSAPGPCLPGSTWKKVKFIYVRLESIIFSLFEGKKQVIKKNVETLKLTIYCEILLLYSSVITPHRL